MYNNNPNQRLFWSLSKPLKYMGLTVDEWFVLLIGFVPGIICLNGAKSKWGIGFLVFGVCMCYAFKKFKKLSEYFLIKSYLVAKGLITPPKGHPNLLKKKVGK